MLVFWSLAGVLLVLVMTALVYPLLSRRSLDGASRGALNATLYAEQISELQADLRTGAIRQGDFELAMSELKGRLLADTDAEDAPRQTSAGRGAAIAVGIAVPLCAIAVYLLVGSPQALGPLPKADPAQELDQHQVEAMVERLAERLKTDTQNVQGWALLARSYAAFGRYKESADAYAAAVKLQPGDAQMLADYADALGMALGRRLEGEPEKLIARALEADPRNLKALALAGTVAFERKDYKAAAGYWERMLPLVQPDSDDARSIRGNVDEARALEAGGPPAATAAPKGEARALEKGASPVAAAAPKGGALRGEVKLAPAIAAQAAPTDTVFIFARAVQGPPMPLAVLRKQVRELPAQFSLDDSMAMGPGASLSGSPQVIVGARVSKSGSPAAQPGDLQGLSAPVANNASGVTVVIDTVVR